VEFGSAVKERHGRGAEDIIIREWYKQCLKGNGCYKTVGNAKVSLSEIAKILFEFRVCGSVHLQSLK
jgi:hypothetical protein